MGKRHDKERMFSRARLLPKAPILQNTSPAGSEELPSKRLGGMPDFGLFVGIAGFVGMVVIFVLQSDGVVEMNWLLSLAIYTVSALVVSWSVWSHATPHLRKKWMRMILVGLSFLILGALGTFGTVKEYRHEHSGAINSQEAKEFEEINQFISEKSEDELRDVFDFSRIEKDGIAIAQESLTPKAKNQADLDRAKRDSINGGRLAFFYRYIDTATPNQVKMIKGKWGILILTPKYASNWDALGRYASSIYVPKEVASALTDLQKTVQENTEVLIDAINEGYTISPDAVANADRPRKQSVLYKI